MYICMYTGKSKVRVCDTAPLVKVPAAMLDKPKSDSWDSHRTDYCMLSFDAHICVVVHAYMHKHAHTHARTHTSK